MLGAVSLLVGAIGIANVTLVSVLERVGEIGLRLFLVLGAVSLLVGAIGIANVTLVSVLERVGEIGLRRALGAGRRHIAGQFLLESTSIGLFGGIMGASIGVLVVVAVSASNDWTPVLDPRVPLGSPLLGAIVGLAAGLYPAWRASAPRTGGVPSSHQRLSRITGTRPQGHTADHMTVQITCLGSLLPSERPCACTITLELTLH